MWRVTLVTAGRSGFFWENPLPKGSVFRHHRSHPHIYSTFTRIGAGTRTRQPGQLTVPCRRLTPQAERKIDQNWSHFQRAIFQPLKAIRNDVGSRMGPKLNQNNAKMVPKWLHKGSPIEWSISNQFWVPIFNDFGFVLTRFFYTVWDRRIMWMKNANVQNHLSFTMDFKDFIVATKSKNHYKVIEKQSKHACFDDPRKASNTSFKHTSKLTPKSNKKKCWKSFKSMLMFLTLF